MHALTPIPGREALLALLAVLVSAPAAAVDFGTLIGRPLERGSQQPLEKPKGIPYCATARASVALHRDKPVCWNGRRLETTWPNGIPLDAPAKPTPPKKITPAPRPPPKVEVSDAEVRQTLRRFADDLFTRFEKGEYADYPQRQVFGNPWTGMINSMKRIHDRYRRTANAGLPGHNMQTLPDLHLEECFTRCEGDGRCLSFDYDWVKGVCHLSNKTAAEVRLRADYPGDPYDHFHRRNPPRATAIPADTGPAPLLTPTTTCRHHLEGPNPWAGKARRTYAKALKDRLCGPNDDSTKPAECFHYVMSGQVAWDKRGLSGSKPNDYTRWVEKNAVNLCAGSTQGTGTAQCFGLHVARGRHWSDALKRCSRTTTPAAQSAPLARATPIQPGATGTASCADATQGKVAWDYKGSTTWSRGNLDRLCRGAERSTEPARCFQRVMHGGVNWGGGTRWQWKNALDLCEQTLNASNTVTCFEKQVAGGRKWSDAIRRCATK